MKRREFLMSAAAITLTGPALAASGQAYSEGLVDAELAAGKTVFVDFYTDWCMTCQLQGKRIKALLAQNPAYEANISFVKVDWDEHSNSELANRLNIPRRSTLVMLKGDQEIGRLVAATGRDDIKALLDAGLAAATA